MEQEGADLAFEMGSGLPNWHDEGYGASDDGDQIGGLMSAAGGNNAI